MNSVTYRKKIIDELLIVSSEIDKTISINEESLKNYALESSKRAKGDAINIFDLNDTFLKPKEVQDLRDNLETLKNQSEIIQEQLTIQQNLQDEDLNHKEEVQAYECEMSYVSDEELSGEEFNEADYASSESTYFVDTDNGDYEKKLLLDKSKSVVTPKEKVSNLLSEMGIDGHKSVRKEYQELLMKTDFFLAFKILSNRIDILPDDEIKQEMEDFFFNYSDVLSNAKDTSLLPKYALYLSEFIQNKALKEHHLEHLIFLFPVGAMSLCFGLLVGGNALSKAKVFLPYINNNLNAYPNLLEDLIAQNKIEPLDFLLENTINHNFDNFEIMNLLMGLSSYEKIYYFFEKYSFNINTLLSVPHHNPNISAVEWNSLWARIIESGNYALFSEILKTSKQRPNFYVHINVAGERKPFSIFYLIRNRADFNLYIETALEYAEIRSDELNSIFTLILNDQKAVQVFIYSGLIEKIFKHPNLKTLNFVEGQSHLFGFLSYVEFWCRSSIKDEIIKSLNYLLHSFIERFPDNMNMPSGAEVNVFGSTIHLMEMNTDSRVFNLLSPILVHYQNWINVEQPSGSLPIELVSNNNEKLKNFLLSLGASVVPSVTVWQKVKFWEKNGAKAVQKQIRLKAPIPGMNSQQPSASGFNLPGESNSTQYMTSDVEEEMRQSFNNLRPLINKLPLDIKLTCDNMFMKAEKLLLLTKDAEKGKFNEDVFFLIQTFNDYLPSILDSYVTSVNLSKVTGKNDGGERDQTMYQLKMLSDHIDTMQENMQLKMQRVLAMDFNKNTNFLKQRLGVTESDSPFNKSNESDDINKDIFK